MFIEKEDLLEMLEESYKQLITKISEVGNTESSGIKWQEGTVKENGVNGLQVKDVIIQTLERVEYLNDEFPCKENEQTLHGLKIALKGQFDRDLDRRERNVEGKYEE